MSQAERKSLLFEAIESLGSSGQPEPPSDSEELAIIDTKKYVEIVFPALLHSSFAQTKKTELSFLDIRQIITNALTEMWDILANRELSPLLTRANYGVLYFSTGWKELCDSLEFDSGEKITDLLKTIIDDILVKLKIAPSFKRTYLHHIFLDLALRSTKESEHISLNEQRNLRSLLSKKFLKFIEEYANQYENPDRIIKQLLSETRAWQKSEHSEGVVRPNDHTLLEYFYKKNVERLDSKQLIGDSILDWHFVVQNLLIFLLDRRNYYDNFADFINETKKIIRGDEFRHMSNS